MVLRCICYVCFLMVGTVLTAQQDNPFTIVRNDSAQVHNKVESSTPSFEEDTKIEGDNPFTVSHIPIRKNQYEQIEKLTLQNRKAEESISITYLPLWIAIVSLCMLAFLIVRNKNHYYNLVRTFINNNLLRQKAYETNGGQTVEYLLGYLIFLMNISLFLYLVAQKLFYQTEIGLFSVFLAVLVFFLGKHLALYLVSNIYEFQKEASIYSFVINTSHNLMTVIFLSLNIIILFGPDAWLRGIFILGVALFVIFLFSRYYIGLSVGRKYLNQFFFHFFLYFCAFEFSPWLVVYTLLRDFI